MGTTACAHCPAPERLWRHSRDVSTPTPGGGGAGAGAQGHTATRKGLGLDPAPPCPRIPEVVPCGAPSGPQQRGSPESRLTEQSVSPGSALSLSLPCLGSHPLSLGGASSGRAPQDTPHSPDGQHQRLWVLIIHWKRMHILPGHGGWWTAVALGQGRG